MVEPFASLAEGPDGSALGLVAIAEVVLQAGVLLVTWSDRLSEAVRRRLYLAAGASLLALPLVAGLAVHDARALMLDGMTGRMLPSESAQAISQGFAGELNGIPALITFLTLAASLWLAGAWRSFGRRPGLARRTLAVSTVFALGLAGVFIGCLRWDLLLVKTFSSLAGLDPDRKVKLLDRALSLARADLDVFVRASHWTLVAITASVAIAAGLSGRAADDDGRWDRRRFALAVASLVLAAAAFVVARPMRAENAMPWPPPLRGDMLRIVEPRTPALDGVDLIERSPVIQVFDDKVTLDGVQEDLDTVQTKLAILRRNFEILNPEGRFNGRTVLIISETAPMGSVAGVLHTLHEGDYTSPLFAFTRAEEIERPTFGRLHRVEGSAALTTLIDPYDVDEAKDPKAGHEGTLVRLADFRDYGALARHLVEVRRAGAPVVLALGK